MKKILVNSMLKILVVTLKRIIIYIRGDNKGREKNKNLNRN